MYLKYSDPLRGMDIESRMDADIRRARLFDCLEKQLNSEGLAKDRVQKLIRKAASEIGWSSGFHNLLKYIRALQGKPHCQSVYPPNIDIQEIGDWTLSSALRSLRHKKRITVDEFADSQQITRTHAALALRNGVRMEILERVGANSYGLMTREKSCEPVSSKLRTAVSEAGDDSSLETEERRES